MTRFTNSALFFLALVLSSSCNNALNQPDYILLLSEREILSSASENYYKVEFETTGAWTSTIDGDGNAWCELLPNKGSTSIQSSILKIQENKSGQERSTTITLHCGEANQSIKIKQEQNVFINPEQSSVEIDEKGGVISLSINSNVDYSCTVLEEDSHWITITNTDEKNQIKLIIAVNDSTDERTGSVVLSYYDFKTIITVIQRAASPQIIIQKSYYDIPSEGRTITIDTKSNIDFSFVVDDNCSTWIHFIETRALAEKAYVFSVDENSSLETREGSIVFYYDSLRDTVTLVQQGIKPSLNLSISSYSFKASGGKLDVVVTSNYPYELSIPSYCLDWIEHWTPADKPNTESFIIQQNNSPDSRSAKVVFKVGSISRTLELYQDGATPFLNVDEEQLFFEDIGGSGEIQVESNFSFSIKTPSWISASIQSEKDGLYVLAYKVYQNYNTTSRVGHIILSGYGLTKMIGVSQSAKKFDVSISLSEAGTLSQYLGSSNKYKITHLTISGPINGTDIRLIRNLAGCRLFPSYFGGSTEHEYTTGALEYLDLSEARIVEGGACYSMAKYHYSGERYDDGYSSCFSTKNDVISPYMFTDCYKLSKVILPKSVVKIESNAFFDHSLSSITLPPKVSEIDCSFSSDFSSEYLKEILIDSANAYYCVENGVLFTKDKKVLLSCPPKNQVGPHYSVPASVQTIRSFAFYACKGISSISLPANLKAIESYAFAECTLDEIAIKNTVEYHILGYLTHFKKVTIESGFTSFNASMFSSSCFGVYNGCTIGQLWVNCSTPPLMDAFFNDEITQSTTLYVPKASKELYYLAAGWGEFKKIVGF